ncbi:MAG: oxidoreductase, partial [Candidatus Eremiobacteraeota bacterium]|nr:oxidoreductase [Candidatus Eremiobacteraeota bacterium]
QEPVQLIAGGSGIVPLMAMIRSRAASSNRAPFRLLYSLRSPESLFYGAELERREKEDDGLRITYAYTRRAPANWPTPPHRIDASLLSVETWPASTAPTCYVCGPTAFVETSADLLQRAGHDPSRIRTERFGPSGGTS